MRTLTVKLPDDVYERVERRAAERGTSLTDYVIELMKHSNGQPVAEARPDPAALLAALDKGRNRTAVGRLNRDELYDRAVLR
jgi:plasmid stability protein